MRPTPPPIPLCATVTTHPCVGPMGSGKARQGSEEEGAAGGFLGRPVGTDQASSSPESGTRRGRGEGLPLPGAVGPGTVALGQKQTVGVF